jgi:hypothetical protein
VDRELFPFLIFLLAIYRYFTSCLFSLLEEGERRSKVHLKTGHEGPEGE